MTMMAESQQSHSPSFLGLPDNVRKRIYLYAGLISGWDIDLNGRRTKYAYCFQPGPDFEKSYKLLFICRLVYSEASSILYSTNRFFIRYNDAGSVQARDLHSRRMWPKAVIPKQSQGLEGLKALTASSLRHLSHLTVHLNISSCLGKSCDCLRPPPDDEYHRLWIDPPLRKSSQEIISEWQTAAHHLRTYMSPSRLRLYFVCDSDGSETAAQVVQPLRNIPTLIDCRIRLARHHDPHLSELAKEAAMRSMGYLVPSDYATSTSSFRFFDLPQEVRYQILEYTDLVTPLCEVEWNPKTKFKLRFSRASCFNWERCRDSRPCDPSLFPACQFRDCWHNGPRQFREIGCFCRRYHAAFSSTCRCWCVPTYLFLVCKRLREDAQEVFFSRNRFVVTSSERFPTMPILSTPPRLEVSLFLREALPSHTLGLLRFLEIVFPPFDHDYLRTGSSAHKDWLQTILYIRDRLNLPSLTLRVYFADVMFEPQDSEFRKLITVEQGKAVFQSYARTLRPLSKLREKGLDRFFVHLTLPFERKRDRDWDEPGNITAVTAQETGLRRWGERMVMGDGYDSTALRRKEDGPSQWELESQEDYHM
jgi:hypothetical protein